MDIHKSIDGYPKIELWISINRLIMDIHNRIMDIQIELWISINQEELWISQYNYGYP